MRETVYLLLIWLGVASALALVLFGWDKLMAKLHRRRVPEAALLGCAASEPPAESTSAAPQETASIPATAPAAEPSAQAPEDGRSAVLYVGTRGAGFQEYDMDYQGELTPELLIQGIADLTG